MAGNDADAADATQEALIAIARGIARFDGRSSFSTWTYRVATNACLDELRRRHRRPDPGLPDDGHAQPNQHETSMDQAVVEKDSIDQALAGLREEYRAAVVLRDLGGFDYAEIAAILGIRPGTVRSRIARGRAALADALSPGNQRGDNDVQADDHA
ncbi:MAG: ECF RNA polymerase sigma factor SigE [Acidimicrobiales bacterium]|nr:ECF RNA polymerase sigma factor SigE [Acidimicrobiales bacterium]